MPCSDSFVLVPNPKEKSLFGEYCVFNNRVCCNLCTTELPLNDFIKGNSNYKGKNYCYDCMVGTIKDEEGNSESDDALEDWVIVEKKKLPVDWKELF